VKIKGATVNTSERFLTKFPGGREGVITRQRRHYFPQKNEFIHVKRRLQGPCTRQKYDMGGWWLRENDCDGKNACQNYSQEPSHLRASGADQQLARTKTMRFAPAVLCRSSAGGGARQKGWGGGDLPHKKSISWQLCRTSA